MYGFRNSFLRGQQTHQVTALSHVKFCESKVFLNLFPDDEAKLNIYHLDVCKRRGCLFVE